MLAVFRRSFYLRFAADVVCFGPPGLGRGPLNALCELPEALVWSEAGLAAQQGALRTGAVLEVAGRFKFDLDGSELWRPPAAPAFADADLAAGLRALADAARRRAPGGLGPLLPGLCEPDGAREPAESAADPLLQAAGPPIAILRHWLADALAGSAEDLPTLDALIGLGPGLTPSGDDFLGGAMAALHHLGRGDIARRLARQILPAAQGATGLISLAHLRCAAAGQASAVLFDALGAVLAGGAGLEPRLDAVHAVGHTSGWDCLAGAAAACGVYRTAA